MGDLSHFRTAAVLGRQQAGGDNRQRRGRAVDVGWCGADPVGLPPAAVQLRRLAVGLPQPVGGVDAAGHQGGDARAGGYNVDNMWGPPWDPAWKRNDPVQQAATIAHNGTRLWIYCAPGGQTDLDQGADPSQAVNASSLESMAAASNRAFQAAYVKAGGTNATFNFPPSGNHSWPYWGAQLTALKPDLIATIGR